jgi:hypothetical protein
MENPVISLFRSPILPLFSLVLQVSHSTTIGAFFGPNLGKVRIIADSNCTIIFYALIPPESTCDHLSIATISAGFFEIGYRSTSNTSDLPGHSHCLWYIGPSNREYHFTLEGIEPNDTVKAHSFRKLPEIVIVPQNFSSSGQIDFFYYRSSRSVHQRIFRVNPIVTDIDYRPIIAVITGNWATLITEKGIEGGDRSDREVFAIRLSFTTMVLLILTIAMLVVMIALIIILIIARCCRPAEVRARMAAQAHQIEEKLLREGPDWPERPMLTVRRGTDSSGIPPVIEPDVQFPGTLAVEA